MWTKRPQSTSYCQTSTYATMTPLERESEIVNLIPIRKVSVFIFLLWLLLVNFLYYAQFKDLIFTHLRW
jgi:hypothetical protein